MEAARAFKDELVICSPRAACRMVRDLLQVTANSSGVEIPRSSLSSTVFTEFYEDSAVALDSSFTLNVVDKRIGAHPTL